jgi:hypothetical protein
VPNLRDLRGLGWRVLDEVAAATVIETSLDEKRAISPLSFAMFGVFSESMDSSLIVSGHSFPVGLSGSAVQSEVVTSERCRVTQLPPGQRMGYA